MSPFARAVRRVALGAVSCAAVSLPIAAATSSGAVAGASHAAYGARSSHYRKSPRFVVRYAGSGRWSTVYHSEPPNQGGNADTNDAHDSSTQSWQLVFGGSVTIPPCGAPNGGGPDRCSGLRGLTGATGTTTATGKIDHTHVDGLYPAQDDAAKCMVGAHTATGTRLAAAVEISYLPLSRRIAVTARNPVPDVLLLLPAACPGQGDSIDGLNDNYFAPGFSFAPPYGPDRWFTSRTVKIPVRAFHHRTTIRIPLGDTPAGSSPKDCSVQNPSYERCTTGGSWAGVLTFDVS